MGLKEVLFDNDLLLQAIRDGQAVLQSIKFSDDGICNCTFLGDSIIVTVQFNVTEARITAIDNVAYQNTLPITTNYEIAYKGGYILYDVEIKDFIRSLTTPLPDGDVLERIYELKNVVSSVQVVNYVPQNAPRRRPKSDESYWMASPLI